MKMNRISQLLVNMRMHEKRNNKALEELIGSANPGEGQRALEVGCGGGMVSDHLASRYRMKVTGTDIDHAQIETAKKRHAANENLGFQVADATRLPFPDGEFDLVASFNMLHHIAEWRAALSEIHRVLRPGGHYILVDMAFARWLAGLLGSLLKNHGFYTPDELSARLRDLSFDFVRVEPPQGLGVIVRKIVLKKRG